MTSGYHGGFERALFWYYDANGGATGQQSTLSNGTTSGAYVIQGPRTAGLNYTDQVDLNFESGDKLVGPMTFGNTKLNAFDMTLSAFDRAAVPLFSGSAVSTTSSVFTKGSINPNRSTPIYGGMCLQQRRLRSDGTEEYFVLFLPKVQISMRHGGFQFRGESDVTLRISPQLSSKAHTGQSFGTGANNYALSLEGDQTDHYFWLSPSPIHIVSYRHTDSNPANVTLVYKPLSEVVTLNASQNELVYNGVPTALTSVTIATSVAVVPAGTAANLSVITHTTNYVPT